MSGGSLLTNHAPLPCPFAALRSLDTRISDNYNAATLGFASTVKCEEN